MVSTTAFTPVHIPHAPFHFILFILFVCDSQHQPLLSYAGPAYSREFAYDTLSYGKLSLVSYGNMEFEAFACFIIYSLI